MPETLHIKSFSLLQVWQSKHLVVDILFDQAVGVSPVVTAAMVMTSSFRYRLNHIEPSVQSCDASAVAIAVG
jgi:hypothetical protein